MLRHPIPVVVFSALYMAVAAPWALRSSNHEFVFYMLVMVFLAGLIYVVDRRVQLHPLTMWGLSIWGLVHMLGGLLVVSEETGVLYSLWLIPGLLKFDQVVHAYGFGLCTWMCWQAISRGLRDPRPTPGLLFLSALAGMGLGSLNEVVEFVAVLTIPETNVGGYENTGWDMVANTLGAGLAAVWIGVVGRRASSG